MMKIASIGWAEIKIEDFHDYASYLTDVPLEVLDALIGYFKSHLPQCVYFDGEGHDFYIIFGDYVIFIITALRKLITIDIDFNSNIYKEIICDIENDMENCINWNPGNLTETETIERENILLDKIKELKILLGVS